MIGRADIEGSKSYVAMNAWQPQASYPCGMCEPVYNKLISLSWRYNKRKHSSTHIWSEGRGPLMRQLSRELTDSIGCSKCSVHPVIAGHEVTSDRFSGARSHERQLPGVHFYRIPGIRYRDPEPQFAPLSEGSF